MWNIVYKEDWTYPFVYVYGVSDGVPGVTVKIQWEALRLNHLLSLY